MRASAHAFIIVVQERAEIEHIDTADGSPHVTLGTTWRPLARFECRAPILSFYPWALPLEFI